MGEGSTGSGDARLPDNDSVWIGVWEQIAGAQYALQLAKRVGVSHDWARRYHQVVRPVVFDKLASGDLDAIPPHWQASFYLNAAYQRVVWAEERYASALGRAKCSCGYRATTKTGQAPSRAEHEWATSMCRHLVERHALPLAAGEEFVGQFVEKDSALNLLRNVMNSRKHGDYPRWAVNTADVKAAAAKWEMMRQAQKFTLVGSVVDQAIGAFGERPWLLFR